MVKDDMMTVDVAEFAAIEIELTGLAAGLYWCHDECMAECLFISQSCCNPPWNDQTVVGVRTYGAESSNFAAFSR